MSRIIHFQWFLSMPPGIKPLVPKNCSFWLILLTLIVPNFQHYHICCTFFQLGHKFCLQKFNRDSVVPSSTIRCGELADLVPWACKLVPFKMALHDLVPLRLLNTKFLVFKPKPPLCSFDDFIMKKQLCTKHISIVQ